MIFGPLSESQLSQVTERLDHYKAHYTVTDSNIEVADSLVPLVEEELVKLGVLAPLQEEELEHEEYLCTQCDYISTHAGSCPSHGGALVDYSAWVAAQRQSGDNKTVAIVFAVVLAIALAIALLQR